MGLPLLSEMLTPSTRRQDLRCELRWSNVMHMLHPCGRTNSPNRQSEHSGAFGFSLRKYVASENEVCSSRKLPKWRNTFLAAG